MKLVLLLLQKPSIGYLPTDWKPYLNIFSSCTAYISRCIKTGSYAEGNFDSVLEHVIKIHFDLSISTAVLRTCISNKTKLACGIIDYKFTDPDVAHKLMWTVRLREICTVLILFEKVEDDFVPTGDLTSRVFGGDVDLDQIETKRRTWPQWILAFLKLITFNDQHTNFIKLPLGLINAKIIILSLGLSTGFLTNCFSCPKDSINVTLNYPTEISRIVRLSFIRVEPTSLHDFDKSWNAIHAQLQNFGSIDDTAMNEPECICAPRVFNDSIPICTAALCVHQIFAVRHNCSSDICRYILTQNFEFQNALLFTHVTSDNTVVIQGFPSSLGTLTDGLKFAVLLGLKEHQRVMNIGFILQPLPPQVWLAIFMAFVTIAIFFKFHKVGFQRGIFVLATYLFEQATTLREFSIPVLSWLYACLLLRNMYTSSMYSHLTKNPDPTGIPETMEQLLYFSEKENLTIFAEMDLAATLLYQTNVEKRLGTGGSSADTTKLLEFSKVVRLDDSVEFVGGLREGRGVECVLFKFQNDSFESIRLTWDETGLGHCGSGGRLAILYSKYGWPYSNNPRFVLPILGFLGRRRIINKFRENFLAEPVMWFHQVDAFLSEKFQITVASLFETGLFQMYKKMFEEGALVDLIAEVNEKGGFGNTWNLRTFAGIMAEADGVGWSRGHARKRKAEAMRAEEVVVILMIFGSFIVLCMMMFFGEGFTTWIMVRNY